jgi:DNA ligase (NAD+)
MVKERNYLYYAKSQALIVQMKFMEESMDEIIIFRTEDGKVTVDVTVEKEMVWLTLNQIAILFGRDKSVVAKHLKNVFNSAELDKMATVANFATVQIEGEREVSRVIEYYNLDVIISIGYRVNSKRGVQFRQWAGQVLKSYLLKGFVLNQQKLQEEELQEIQQTIALFARALSSQDKVSDIGVAAMSLILEYTKTWHWLLKYDDNQLVLPTMSSESHIALDYTEVGGAILALKQELISIGEATTLFGRIKGDELRSILGNIEQSFAGVALYETIEIKAAHLLYFLIKDHPFIDGNKRIGSLLFLLYLKQNRLMSSKLNDVSLTTLALLVAESNPAEKDLIIKLIVNLISI